MGQRSHPGMEVAKPWQNWLPCGQTVSQEQREQPVDSGPEAFLSKGCCLWVLMVSQPCSFSHQPTGGQVQGRPLEPWGPFEVSATRGSSFRCLAPSRPPFPSHWASRGWFPGTLLSTLTGGPGYRDNHPLSAVSPYFTVI